MVTNEELNKLDRRVAKRQEQLDRDVKYLVTVVKGGAGENDINRQLSLIKQSTSILVDAAREFGEALGEQATLTDSL